MKNAYDLTGKKVVMTGAGGDIGRATAGVLAELGATLVLSDLNDAPGHDIPAGAVWQACDVTDRASSEALAAAHDWFDRVITGPLVGRLRDGDRLGALLAARLGYATLRSVGEGDEAVLLLRRNSPPVG